MKSLIVKGGDFINFVSMKIADNIYMITSNAVHILKSDQIEVTIDFIEKAFPQLLNFNSERNSFTYQCVLSEFPHIKQDELNNLINFILCNLIQERRIGIICKNDETRNYLINSIREVFGNLEKKDLNNLYTKRLNESKSLETDSISLCGQCYEGKCITKMVSHTTSIKNAIEILRSGYLKASSKLKTDVNSKRWQPPEYDDGIFFVYANCHQSEQKFFSILQNTVKLTNYSKIQGARFYFLNSDLKRNENYSIDGFHICRIEYELPIIPYVKALVLPSYAKGHIPNDILEKYMRVIYFTNFKNMSCLDTVHQSYEIVKNIFF